MANPFLGVLLHWLDGLASGSFYVPSGASRSRSGTLPAARNRRYLLLGFDTLVLSTMIVGLGNYLGAYASH